MSRPAAGFFLAPGLGKTLITLTVYKILKELGYVDELVVFAKRRIVYNVWRQEIKKWKFPFKPVIVHGKDRIKNLFDETADVRLINYEGIHLLSNRIGRSYKMTPAGKEFFARGKRIMVAFDESSKLRHTSTKRFHCLKKILDQFCRRYILTGSPVPNGMMNLFGQVYALDLGETLGTYITQFRNAHFHPSGYMGYEWKLIPGHAKKIYDAIKPLVIRFGTDQLKMPPLKFIDKYVDLPKEALKQYQEMEEEYLLEYEEGAVVAANAAVASNKLRQIANGHVYYSATQILDVLPKKKPPRKWRPIHDEKCEELVELLEELQGEPALVAFEFEHDKLHLQSYFRAHAKQFANAPFIDGSSKDRDVTKILRKWNRGEVPVLFGNPENVAHGLNLQGKGGIVIYFCQTWNLENYEQFYQRVWRQGQKRRVLVYRLITRGTVDEDVIAALKIKDHDQQTLLEAMQRRVKTKLAA